MGVLAESGWGSMGNLAGPNRAPRAACAARTPLNCRSHSYVAVTARIVTVLGLGLVVANCGAGSGGKLTSKVDPKYGVSASPRVVALGQPVPKGGGTYRVGKPYQVAGRTYVPKENPRYRAEGIASWYGEDFHGRLTANGEIFDMESIAAAHPTMPIPSYARVTNLDNGRSMIVRVNDRGPYHSDRVIDVSSKAADLLGFKRRGTARVRVEYTGRAPLEGSDDRKLVATLRNDGSAPMPAGGAPVMVASAGGYVPNTSRLPASVPMPPDRPFDLGEIGAVATAEPAWHEAPAAPAPVAPVQRRTVAAALPKPVIAPRQQVVAAGMVAAPLPPPAQVAAAPARPVRVASTTPAPAPLPAPDSLSASGWMVGAQPVSSYAPAPTPVSTARGLY